MTMKRRQTDIARIANASPSHNLIEGPNLQIQNNFYKLTMIEVKRVPLRLFGY